MNQHQMITFKVQSDTAFWVNGWLVDLIRIEHWGRNQGAGKFHGIRTILSILKHFMQKIQRADQQPLDPPQVERTMLALQRLSGYGYYVPPEVFKRECDSPWRDDTDAKRENLCYLLALRADS